MEEIWTYIFFVTCGHFLLVLANGLDVRYYTNKWMVHVPYGEMAAKEVARSQNLTYKEPDLLYNGFHYMVQTNLPSKLFEKNEEITNGLTSHELVSTAFQETIIAWTYRNKIISQVVPKDLALRSNYRNAFNDKKWLSMWYLQDFRIERTQPVLDINVVPVYFELKTTGKSVNISVVDSGMEWNHPELSKEFNPDISYNLINQNNDITPNIDHNGDIDSHGTRISGIISMKPNNKLCGVGIAYGAKIGCLKVLDMHLTSSRKAKALNYALDYVDIYSSSWGPPDTGYNMDPLSKSLKLSLSKGTEQGRNGKGVAYLFACGNGKIDDDNCACDSHINSIYTIGVAACDDSGHPTFYSERCAAIMVTTYVGSGSEKTLVTTTVNGECYDEIAGTSAATPVVSGVVGLAFSANPKLTWRDILHLLAWTSQVAPLSDNLGWNRNTAGFYYSVDFGFGLINAYKLVRAAKIWKNVPKMKTCEIRMPKVKGFPITKHEAVRIIVPSTGCEGLHNEVKFIEQIQLVVTMAYPKRGDIQIAMKSPAGTEVHVLESRKKDADFNGLKRWAFLVVAFWGESPRGQFIIDIYDKTGSTYNKGEIVKVTLIIHGTKEAPTIYNDGPRPYEDFSLASSDKKPTFLQLSSMRKKYLQELKRRKEGNSLHNTQNINETTVHTVEQFHKYYKNVENYNALYNDNEDNKKNDTANLGTLLVGNILNYLFS